MAVTASVTGTIKITDNLTGSTSLSKVLNNAYTGTVENYGQSVLIGTSPVTIALPVSPAQFLYVKNLSTTLGNTITITWTPTSGSSNIVVILDPGALLIFSEVTTTNGISALSIVASLAATPIEYILCG
jgi:hypothetical protein